MMTARQRYRVLLTVVLIVSTELKGEEQLLTAIRPYRDLVGLSCSNIHTPSLSQVEILKMFTGLDGSREKVHKAMAFLAQTTLHSQTDLVNAWEEMAKIISMMDGYKWKSYRFFGTDESVGYQGPVGHVIVFAKNGGIYIGSTSTDFRSGQTWPADYRKLQELKAPVPQTPK